MPETGNMRNRTLDRSMVILAHPTGNQNVRNAALSFAEAGVLQEFWTCLAWRNDGWSDHIHPEALRRELSRRSLPADLMPFVRTRPWREAGRLLSARLGLQWLTTHERGVFSVDAVYEDLDRCIAKRLRRGRTPTVVYGYDGGAVATFETARAVGVRTVYDHPIGHWRAVRRLQEEEAELHPEWKGTLGGLRDSEAKLARKDRELSLANLVIVASSFSKRTLADAPVESAIEVVPYGCPPPAASIHHNPSGKLRVLFVGHLSQAKGVGYLLEAILRLGNHVELTLVGGRVDAAMPTLTMLNRFRWIPSLPHGELLLLMRKHDVLVHPSLHEGFGLVILEALSQGLAVIATSNTGAPDVITEGREGFVVPIRSAHAIVEKLDTLIRDRDRLHAMRAAALETAGENSWQTYRKRLVETLRRYVL